MLIERVDGYAFHPGARLIVEAQPQLDPAEIPWAPLRKSLTESVVSMVSSAAIHLKTDSPFDYDREWEVPTWGDPSYREIPSLAGQDDVEYSHAHINTSYMAEDRNVAWPVDVFREFEGKGLIGRLAETLHSIYGYLPNPYSRLTETAPVSSPE